MKRSCNRTGLCRVAGLLVVFSLASVGVSAQEEVGAVYGTVASTDGGALPGTTVTLQGVRGERTQISDAQGRFRFLRLDPGLFDLEARLDGFSPVLSPSVLVRAGRNTTVQLQLDPAIQDQITVTAQTELLDPRQLIQGAALEQLTLEQIPTSRDPWALLDFAPGVLTDRIDIGGTRAQQSIFSAPAVPYQQGDWLLDGAQVTHPVGGESGTYYDFEQFEQIDVATGGNDITKRTAGASVSLVTRRGTNDLRGSARYLLTDDDLFWFFKQSDPAVDPGEFPPDQGTVETNQIDSIDNYGLELGGPLLRDRIWLWGAYGHNDTDEIKVNGFPQDSTLDSVVLKLNAQVSSANSLVTSWNNTDKQIADRGAGVGSTWEATWFQRGPVALFKLEDSQVFRSDLFLTGMFAHVDGGFSLTPNGCIAAGGCDAAAELLWDADGVFKNSNAAATQSAPADEIKLDGSWFVATGRTSHELRFGGRYREIETHEVVEYPGGRNIFHIAGDLFDLPEGIDLFAAVRGSGEDYTQRDRALWLQDTMTRDAWTINLGLRYDGSDGYNNPLSIAANPALPEVLPAIEFPGNDGGGLDWRSISPRVGVTYALGAERKTLLRASYARFAQALTWVEVSRVHPAGLAYAYYYFADANGDNMWQENETILGSAGTWGFDPADPTALETPNVNDPDLAPGTTDEVILGLEHSFLPELVAGFDLTWRTRRGIHELHDLIYDLRGVPICEEIEANCDPVPVRQARRDDYVFYDSVEVVQPDGRYYTVDFYTLGPSLAFTGGSLLTNGDRRVEYRGATATLTKRLSNRWMASGYLNYGRSEWDIPASYFEFDDPTDADPFGDVGLGGAAGTGDSDNDGQIYAQGGGRTRGLVMESGWSFNLHGLVQIVPERWWGFNVAGNVYGRQGYPRPLRTTTRIPGVGSRRAQAVAVLGDFRYDDVYTFDLRVDKEVAVTRNLGIALSADCFNVFNSGVVLERDNTLGQPLANFVTETLSPRIWRLGVRFNWR